MSVGKATTSVTENQGLRLTKVSCSEAKEHIYACKFSEDGKFFATTYGNGVCRVFDNETFAPHARMKSLPQHQDIPSTSVKWGKMREEGVYEFASCSSGGGVYGWRWDRSEDASQSFVERHWKGIEENNDTASIDYNPDGTVLVSVGSDRKVRVYDTETRKLLETLEKGVDDSGHTRTAHTNRIFSAKFTSNQTLLTGGWANPVQVWDMRSKRSERQLGGPAMGSDSIEPLFGTSRVVISSNRKENQLQVFDSISGTEITSESEKLSKACGSMGLMGVRYMKETQSLFCIAHKPDCLIHMDATSGEVRGIIDDIGAPLYAGDTGAANPTRAVFVGAKETIVVVDVL